jgi:glycine/D-amino acid oxidase-like deaminating enzyme
MCDGVPCTRLVITAGPWTPAVFSSLFPSASIEIPITPLAGHSVVLKSPRWTEEHAENGESHAVFTTNSSGFSPEFFSRTGGEIWFGGLNSTTISLPPGAGEAQPNPEDIMQLMVVAKRLLGLPGKEDLEVLREGLCFRPVMNNGRPIVSRVPDEKLGAGLKTRGAGDGGVFISAGHGPWGISQSLGTGKVLTELMEGVETSCDISRLVL